MNTAPNENIGLYNQGKMQNFGYRTNHNPKDMNYEDLQKELLSIRGFYQNQYNQGFWAGGRYTGATEWENLWQYKDKLILPEDIKRLEELESEYKNRTMKLYQFQGATKKGGNMEKAVVKISTPTIKDNIRALDILDKHGVVYDLIGNDIVIKDKVNPNVLDEVRKSIGSAKIEGASRLMVKGSITTDRIGKCKECDKEYDMNYSDADDIKHFCSEECEDISKGQGTKEVASYPYNLDEQYDADKVINDNTEFNRMVAFAQSHNIADADDLTPAVLRDGDVIWQLFEMCVKRGFVINPKFKKKGETMVKSTRKREYAEVMGNPKLPAETFQTEEEKREETDDNLTRPDLMGNVPDTDIRASKKLARGAYDLNDSMDMTQTKYKEVVAPYNPAKTELIVEEEGGRLRVRFREKSGILPTAPTNAPALKKVTKDDYRPMTPAENPAKEVLVPASRDINVGFENSNEILNVTPPRTTTGASRLSVRIPEQSYGGPEILDPTKDITKLGNGDAKLGVKISEEESPISKRDFPKGADSPEDYPANQYLGQPKASKDKAEKTSSPKDWYIVQFKALKDKGMGKDEALKWGREAESKGMVRFFQGVMERWIDEVYGKSTAQASRETKIQSVSPVQDDKYAQQITTEDNRTEKAIKNRLGNRIENSDKVAKWMASRGYGEDEALAISDALDSGKITKDQLQEKLERSGFPTSNLPTAGRLR